MQGRSAIAKIGVCSEWTVVGNNSLKKAHGRLWSRIFAGMGVYDSSRTFRPIRNLGEEGTARLPSADNDGQ